MFFVLVIRLRSLRLVRFFFSSRRLHTIWNCDWSSDVCSSDLSEVRGPAPVAQTLYRETDASREARLKLAEERRAMPHFEASREGKPSKRDRRELDRLRRRV